MQYTIRKVPKKIDALLRRRAREQRKSLNEVALEALSRAVGATGEPVEHHDLDFLIGTWVDDPAFAKTRAEHNRVDPKDWQ